jgi:hypothetical protein
MMPKLKYLEDVNKSEDAEEKIINDVKFLLIFFIKLIGREQR